MTHFLGVLPLHVIKWMFFSATPLSAEEVYMHICFMHILIYKSLYKPLYDTRIE